MAEQAKVSEPLKIKLTRTHKYVLPMTVTGLDFIVMALLWALLRKLGNIMAT